MTDALELRKAVAEKIGWRRHDLTFLPVSNEGIWECVNCGETYCSPPWTKERITSEEWCDGRREATIPPYESSMDACLRDLVPWARERGWWVSLSQESDDEWCCSFYKEDYANGDGTTPAEALCLAVLKLLEVRSHD